ncbi:MAG: hypothetical protein PHN81_05005 [Actinomycetota bacterium]|nr:hypothetical protein [Actinomycetota bacterium]
MRNYQLTRILIILLVIVYFLLFLVVYTNERWSDGDEVHYLAVTSSIMKDFDLVLDNNYENKDYFTHHSHEEKPHAYPGRYGELRPQHGILPSIIMVPGYWLSTFCKETLGLFESNRAFLFFPRLTMLFIHIIFSLVLINFLKTLGFDKNISILCVILYLIQLPIIIYSQAIYSDLLAGYFIMMGVFGVLLFAKTDKYKWLTSSSIFLGLTIFLHTKIIIFSTLLIISSFVYLHLTFKEDDSYKISKWFKSGYYRKIAYCILGPWLFLTAGCVLMKFYWFGSFYFDGLGDPSRKGGYLSLIKRPFTRGRLGQLLSTKAGLILVILAIILLAICLYFLIKKKKFLYILFLLIILALAYSYKGWLGQWLDIEAGLIPNAPLLALIFPGLFIWYRKDKPSFLLIVPATIIYLSIKAGVSWNPGFSPAGRYLMIAIPVLLPALCWVLWSARKIVWLRWIVGILTFLSIVLSSLIPFVGWMGLPYSKGYNIYWRTILNFLRLDFLEPYISLNFLKPKTYYYYIGLGIFVLLLILGFYLQRKITKIEKLEEVNS